MNLPSESKPQAKLNLALRKCRSKCQRRAGSGQYGTPVWLIQNCSRANAVHNERGIARWALACNCAVRNNAPRWIYAKQRVHLVVHARVVGVVGDVESLSCKLQRGLLTQLVLPSEPHIEVGVIRSQARVPAGADGALVRSVIVPVNFGTRKQVKRMSGVVSEDGGKLETGKDCTLPGASNHTSDYNLMALIKLRKAAVESQIRRILRTVVAVEIRASVEALTEGIVGKECEVVAEILFNL